jgi:filamentous hemagglutinin family protein
MDKFRMTLLATTALVAINGSVLAQTAPQVAAGAATIVQTPGKTIINQTSNRAAIDWREFGVKAGEELRINQPGAGSVSLQRVTGNSVSRIDGNLSSNGQVWIANPNGVIVGNSGQINVNGLMATTGRVDVDHMMATGNARISGATGAPIMLEGQVKAGQAGVALVGRDVTISRNSLVEALGNVAVGAGAGGEVGYAGDRLVNFSVDPATAAKIVAAGGITGAGVKLVGLGGGSSIAVEGTIKSTGDGSTWGVAVSADQARIAGVVEAPGQKVEVAGQRVEVSGILDVSGDKAGSIAVGGGWQGAPMATGRNSQQTVIKETAQLKANGKDTGGVISVWSDGQTSVAGRIAATGAREGGSVETSGKKALAVLPSTSVTTAGAKAGSWLIDPDVLEVVVLGSGMTLDTLGYAGAVGAVSSGVSQIDPSNLATATTNIRLVATTQISVTSGILLSGGALLGKSLTLNAPSVVLNNSIVTNHGDLIIRNVDGSSPAAVVSSNSSGIISLGSGKLDVVSGSIALTGTVAAANVSLSAGSGALSVGNITASSSGSIALSGGSVVLTGSNVTAGSIGATSAITINSTTVPAVLRGNIIGGTLTTTGGVVLAAGTTFGMEGGGSIGGNVDGAQNLTLNGPGTMTLAGAVGGVTPLASITRSGGVVALGGDVAAGVVNLGSAALLADTTISSAGGVISGSFDGAHVLALRSTGANAVTYTGVSGGITPLASISLASSAPLAQSTNLSGTLIASGTVSLDPGSRPIVLTGNSAVSSTSAAVVIGGTVDGAFGLALGSPIAVTVGANAGTISGVGGNTALASLDVVSNGTVSFAGSTTAGSIDVAAPVALNNQILTATSGVLALGSSTQLTMISGTTGLIGQSINVRGPLQLNAAADLSVSSYGLAHFGTISAPAGGTVSLSSSNSGAVDLGGFSGTGTLSIAGAGRVINTVGVFSGAVQGLDVNTISLQSGLTTISQAAGASPISLGPIAGVGSLSYSNSGTGALTLASVGPSVAGVSIVNGGVINLPSSLNVGGTSSITGTSLQVASGGISLSSGGRLDLNGSLVASATTDTVSIGGGVGMVALNGSVGGATSFASLISSSGTLGLGGNVTAATIAISSPLVLTGNATLSAVSTLTPSPTLISGTVDGPFSLMVTGKPVSLVGVVGGSTPLTSLDLSGAAGPAKVSGLVTTTGAQSYNGMLLLGSAALSSGAGTISTGAVDSKDGGQGLSISTGTGAVNVGSLGGGTVLASVSISSGQASPLVIGSVTANGAVSISSGLVALSGSTISSGGAVTLGSTVSLAGSNSVSANGAANLGNLVGPGDLNIGGTVSTVGISSATGVGTLGLMAGGTLTPTGSVSAATISNLSTQTISIGANSATIAQTGAAPMTIGTVISSGGSFAAASGGNLTISSSIANLAGADLKAAGTLNIASGVTIAPTGALSIAGSSISNAGSLSAGGAVTVAADNSISVGTIGGTGAMTVRSMTAGRGISVGSSLPSTLFLADLSLGNGRSAMTVGGGSVGTVSFGGPVSRSGNLDVISGSGISVSAPLSVSGGTLSLSAPMIMASASISDTGGAAKMSGSSISLAGGTFSSGLTVNASTINLGTGSYSGSISATGSTTLAGTFSAPVSIAGSGVLSSGTVSTLSVSGGNLTVNGGTLTGPVNVSGGLALNGGTISTSSLVASSGITAKGLVTLNSPLTGSLTQTGALTLAGAGTPNLVLTQAGFGLTASNLTIAAGSKLSGSMSISGGLTIAGAQLVAAETITAGSVTINGAVTGPGALSITTPGTGRVTGSGSISGLAGLNVTTGMLSLTNAAFTKGTLSASGAISGTYNVGTGGLSVSTPNLSGTITSAGPVTMAVTQVTEAITAPSLAIGPYQGQGPRGALTGVVAGSTDQSAITLTAGAGSALTFNGQQVTGSKATIASKPFVPSIASMATLASTPSAPRVTMAVAPVVLVATRPVSTVDRIIAPVLPQLLAVLSGSGLAPLLRPDQVRQFDQAVAALAADRAAAAETQAPDQVGVTASGQRDAMLATPAGGFIPRGLGSVSETGAPLANAQTIKVDPLDAGGVGGQVLFAGSGQGGSRVLIPGLVRQEDDDRKRRTIAVQPPLAQQPSEINDELLF